MNKTKMVILTLGFIFFVSSCVTSSDTVAAEETKSIEHNQYEWILETNGAILSAAVIDENRVYFTNDNGTLFCLDRMSGEQLYIYESGADYASTPVIYNDNIIYSNGAGDLLFINKLSGELVKSMNFGETSKKDQWDYFLSEPLIYQGDIYIGGGSNSFYKISAENLNMSWEFSTTDAVHNKALIIDDKVIFSDMWGITYCLNKDSGVLIWELTSGDSVMGSYAYSDNLLYFGSRDTNTYAIDISNGEIVWEYDHGHSWIMSTPVIDGDLLYVGGSDNFVVQAFNKKTGDEIWSTPCDVNIATRPLIIEEVIYYSAGDSYNTYGKGSLFALDKKSGEMLYRFNTTSSFSSPAIVDNLAYFGTKKGDFYCVDVQF